MLCHPNPRPPTASADSPGVGIGLREASGTERAEDDLGVAGRHIGPEDLLDIVDPVEVAGCPHVAMPLAAVGRDDDQVKVILEYAAGRVRPDKRDLERCPKAHGADSSTAGARAFARGIAGDLDRDRVFVALVELPDAFAAASVRVRAGDDHGAGEVDPAEPRVVVG